MKKQPCTKDTEFRWLCSCDDCARDAAGSWINYMDRVFDSNDSLTLSEANTLQDNQETHHGV